ncbi:GNAT family N-acetyltransferase [Utexia brackfieldae]|uniref:GNAT family N-acetyltransferase n=1 Tax=Utexia brackfieldae TaxID=3074108 RepID=UPI00370D4921
MTSCADIWLAASLIAHDFIPAHFWHQQYANLCEKYLSQSDIYLATYNEQIVGFAATTNPNTIAALFVHPSYWHSGVGQALLSDVLKQKPRLQLTVYAKNRQAINFYLKQGFNKLTEQICPYTDETEWIMTTA